MRPLRHGLKESYKQLGTSTFGCMVMTLMYASVGFFLEFKNPTLSLAGLSVSAILFICAGITAALATISFVAHYFNLFKVYMQNTTTGQSVMLRHSSRYIDVPGWVLHRSDGPAVSGFDLHSEEDFALFYFEGAPIDSAVYEKIALAKTKGELNQFLTSPDEHHRNFAKFKMRSL